MTIFLDSSPLSLLTHPRQTATALACNQWLEGILDAGWKVLVPEIIDYELRREFIRVNRTKSIRRLDFLNLRLGYLPITTEAMRHAAELWATTRNTGQPTAPDNTIDVDIILAAQVRTSGYNEVIVATTNVGHLSRYINAAEWSDIQP